MPASTSQRRTKPKVRRNSDVIVSMDGFIDMLDDYMVWYRDKRIKTEFGHGHHGPSTRARSCGMIGGDGINDESNKTAPAPSVHLDLTKYSPSPT